ncbi:MAG: MOSC domain-containing protein [Oscillospiraceae bacterium]|nr:MOSC domain-containing protein [Oscillospiraceae bacterium]
MATVKAVCVSEKKGTVKIPALSVTLRANFGVVGDAHAGVLNDGAPHRQVSLLGQESVDKMAAKFPGLSAGVFAENILTEGITLFELPVGTRLRVGETLLRVSQIGKECHAGCAIREKTGDCVMPREGIFAVVVEGGDVRPGDIIAVV